MSATYFEIGRMIVEQEQQGEKRAEYGKNLIKDLSAYLGNKFGQGFSETNLRSFRKFFLIYSNKVIQQMPSAESENAVIMQKGQMPSAFFKLSWSHYQVLMRIENENERNFYEIEAEKGQWSVEQLKRQYHSSLYERLALSKNKNEVIKLANEGQVVRKSQDLLKNPLVLEFLGIEEKSEYSESDLETAIISKLQSFMLELGKGFCCAKRKIKTLSN